MFKKMMVTVLALVAACVGAFQAQAANLSVGEIKSKLQRNELLPSIYLAEFGTRKTKNSLGQLAQQQVVKHKNYVAYYNAAVIYLTNAEILDGAFCDLTSKDLANVKKYASAAIKISPKSPDMYLARGLAVERFLGLAELSNMSYPGRDVLAAAVKKHKAEVLEMLNDFETVGKLQPSMAPWASMAAYYEILGKAEDARRCRVQDETYTRTARTVKKQFKNKK